MNKNCVIAIDYGTQSVRVSIINTDGEFLAFEQEKYSNPYFSVKPGYCEQDPNYYYENMCRASRRLVKNNPSLLKHVRAISATSLRDSPVFLGENKEILRPAIVWLDQRQAKLERKLPPFYQCAFNLVGMRDTIIFNRKRTPALWVQENEPELWAKVKHYVPLNSYLNYRLTGVLGDSASNMTGHFPINFKKNTWYNKNSLKGCIFGVEPELMPQIFFAGETLGKISKVAAKETSFPEGLEFIATGSDKSCEVLGCGSIEKNSAQISYGTSCTISLFGDKYFEPEHFLPSYPSCVKGYYNSEIQVYRGYWMLTWFSKEFASEEMSAAYIEQIAPEEILNKKLLEIPPGSNGLVLQPYWGPSLSKPLAKGSIIGFYDIHTKIHIYRAIIEGIAYELKDGLNNLSKRGRRKIDKLIISGGGSKSDAICQITADIFNLPVFKPATYEASSLGCAMSTFIALGDFKDVEEAKEKIVHYKKIFTPNKENVEKYKILFSKVYSKIYPSLNKVYATLSKYLEDNNETEL